MAENNAKAPEQESNFKALVLPVIVLVVICLVCSALLAVLNDITAPIIAENTQAETLAAYVSVLPEGTTTDSMTAIDGLTTAGVEGAVKTANGDVAVKAVMLSVVVPSGRTET
jgi:electron transport complex protein RnfG